MNRIGIIGAMEIEVATLKAQLEDIKVVKKAAMEFYEGTYEGKTLVVVRSGIGKVNAGVCAQILVDDFKVEAIINSGIAGGLHEDIEIGDIVISTDAIQHDMDATGFGYKVGQIPQMKESIFKADERLVKIASEVCQSVNPEVKTLVGRVVTGDQFISGKEKKDWLRGTFDGYCAEMEGGAIAQAAYLNEIPFVIIRSISDKADSTACDDYPQFEKKAADHAVNLVNGMISKM
ncbi:5'-methylthioadenosine nucleosidase [Lachnospiraceae bacterium KM106-2]|nr:5'-methylthioadenosine nucleosidase [Lachnospiraceae bacterium KM106-2]